MSSYIQQEQSIIKYEDSDPCLQQIQQEQDEDNATLPDLVHSEDDNATLPDLVHIDPKDSSLQRFSKSPILGAPTSSALSALKVPSSAWRASTSPCEEVDNVNQKARNTCRPLIQWDGKTWRQGPKRLRYLNDILPNLQRGDRLSVRRLKNRRSRQSNLLKRRPHIEHLITDMDKVLKKHFGENVFFSGKNWMKTTIENMDWEENLKVSDLGDEDPRVKGEITFGMSFTIECE